MPPQLTIVKREPLPQESAAGLLTIAKREPLPTAKIGPAPTPESRRQAIMQMVDEGEHLGGPVVPVGIGAGLAGVSAASKAMQVAKTAGEIIKPIAKFEAVKYGLQAIGVPDELADAAAFIVSGGRRAKPEPAAPTKPTPKPRAPRAAKPPIVTPPPAQSATQPPAATPAPAAAEPAPAPASSVPRGTKSPQQMANEAGQGVRRAAKAANADFTKEQFEAAGTLVDQGMSPAQAVMQIKNAMRDPNAAAKLAEMLQGRGALSVEEMNAEIAARVGNRSPQRGR